LLLLALALLAPGLGRIRNKPALCLDKIRKCRSADWKRTESENAENAAAYRGPAFFFGFFFFNEVVFIEGLLGRARQSCCPEVPDHVKENAKQVIEGKAAPKVLKTQSDAVVAMGTKAKMASVGIGHGDVRQDTA
jgi:hypothetical protein